MQKKYLADDVEHLYTSFNNGTSISERDFIRSHLHNSFLRALCMSLSLIFSFLIVYHEAFVTQLFSRSCTNHLVESKSVFLVLRNYSIYRNKLKMMMKILVSIQNNSQKMQQDRGKLQMELLIITMLQSSNFNWFNYALSLHRQLHFLYIQLAQLGES